MRGRVLGMRFSRRRPGDVPKSLGELPKAGSAPGEPQPEPAEEARARAPSAKAGEDGEPTGLWRQDPGPSGPGLRGPGGVEPPNGTGSHLPAGGGDC